MVQNLSFPSTLVGPNKKNLSCGWTQSVAHFVTKAFTIEDELNVGEAEGSEVMRKPPQ